jgi:hypothetical protein
LDDDGYLTCSCVYGEWCEIIVVVVVGVDVVADV